MKRSVRIFWRIALGLVVCFFIVVVLAAAGVFGPMPSMRDLENPTLLQTSEVYAADGTLMGKYYHEHGNRSNVNYSDISKHVIDALISTEDIRFYKHSGIDMRGTMRAIVTLGKGGGGSTITQQLAKALLEQGFFCVCECQFYTGWPRYRTIQESYGTGGRYYLLFGRIYDPG